MFIHPGSTECVLSDDLCQLLLSAFSSKRHRICVSASGQSLITSRANVGIFMKCVTRWVSSSAQEIFPIDKFTRVLRLGRGAEAASAVTSSLDTKLCPT